MGTRNMTMVIDEKGVKKIAQYGQWDGYPSGQGVRVLEFLKDEVLFKSLVSNLPKVRFLDVEGADKAFIDSYNANAPEWSRDPDNRTPEQISWFENYYSRNLGAEILWSVASADEDEILLIDRTSTAESGGWVEWSYVINLKENTLSVHGHVDEPPIKVYNLFDLPTEDEFLRDLEPDEDEEE